MKIRNVFIIVLVIEVVFSVNSTIVFPAPAGVSVIAAPPTSGDWIITGVETHTGETFKLNGSIVVENGGSLTFSSCEIIFMGDFHGLSASDGEWNITVLPGGSLTIKDNSKVTTDDPAYLSHINATGATSITFSDSSIEYLGYGTTVPMIRIQDITNVSITRCNITGPASQPIRAGIFFDNVSNGVISENTITTDNPTASFTVGNAIEVRDSNATVVTGNNMTCLDEGRPYLFVHSPYSDVRDNTGWNNNTYTNLYFYGGCSYSKAINNRITNGQAIGINLILYQSRGSHHVIIENNDVKTNSGIAIHAGTNSSYITVKNNIVYSETGISIDIYSSNNTFITGNVISSGSNGIHVENCFDSLISGNTVRNTTVDAISLVSLTGSDVHTNKIRNINPSNTAIDGIRAKDCLDVNISNNEIDFTGGDGIGVQNTNASQITDNTIFNAGDDGIQVWESINTIIGENTVTRSNSAAIHTYSSSDLTISSNVLYKNYGNGIYVYSTETHHLDITGNSITDNNYGIYLTTPSHNCTVTENYIAENHYGAAIYGDDHVFYNNSFLFNFYGVYVFSPAAGNLFYYNDFIGNTIQARDISSYGANDWSIYLTVPSERFIGNFWSDYSGIDVVAPSGVGDTPYNITGTANVADLYPLMEFITVLPPPSINSPADVTILLNSTGRVIVWTATTSLQPQSYTITVNGTEIYNVAWDGSPIVYSLDDLAVNATVYSVTITVYDNLGQATSDTVIITVEDRERGTGLPFDPFSLIIGAVIGGGLIAVIGLLLRRKS
ncbi:MAG: NosD domain-containing protein [Candidatus Odinarchaeota archaeon]